MTTREARLEAVVKAALRYSEKDWGTDEEINGGDLLQWFAEWREHARKALRVPA